MSQQPTENCKLRRRAAHFVLIASAWCAATSARGDVPALTVDNSQRLIGKTATLDMTVVSTKFAERRKMQFLSSAANFRGRSNLTVAIRQKDLTSFRRAGIDDLAARYQNHRIRARGQVVRDEGQILLVVRAPGQIKVLDPDPGVPKPDDNPNALLVVDPRGREKTFKLPLAEGLPRQTLRVDHEGAVATYSGVTLAAVLEQAGITLGQQARGRQLARYVVVSANDDYAVVFSVAEIDPYLSDQTVLLAESVDGRPIATREVPLLVVSGDKRQRRWMRAVARVEVRSAAAGSADRDPASDEASSAK